MQHEPLEDSTHLGWCHQTSTGDDDHLLIRHDLGMEVDPGSAETQLHFNNEEAPSALVGQGTPEGGGADDAAIEDATIDAPAYLWGGDELRGEPPVVFGDSQPKEAVFS
jgi:hypothetical protein